MTNSYDIKAKTKKEIQVTIVNDYDEDDIIDVEYDTEEPDILYIRQCGKLILLGVGVKALKTALELITKELEKE